MQFDHHLIPFEPLNTSVVHLSESNQVLGLSMYTEKTENGKILGQLHIMNPQHISSLHLRNLITSKIIWEKHLKQQPPHTPSQCYLVFVRGTGLHVCKNDIIKVFTFENTITHSRTPAFLLPLLLLTHTWIHLLSPWRQCTSSTGGNKHYVNTCACRWKDTTQHLLRLDRSKFWLDRAVKTKNKKQKQKPKTAAPAGRLPPTTTTNHEVFLNSVG